MTIRTLLRVTAFLAFAATATTATAQDVIRLRIASGHPAVNTYVNLMQGFFVPEVTKRVAAKTKYKVEFVEGYGGAMVKVADTLEGVQSGIIDIGGYCFCFEPSNLPLHAFQVMLPFGTMDPTTSLQVARAVYDKVPYMSKVFEDKFKQKLIALIADNGYNLGTNMEWNNVSDLKGVKLAGAGLNLKWLEFAGAVPVQGSLVEAYTGMQTGIYNGWIMFPSGWLNSQHKARASARYRRPTVVFERLLGKGAFFNYLPTLDDVIASRGGNPLMAGGKIIGAIGVSGGTGSQDDVVSQAGVAALK